MIGITNIGTNCHFNIFRMSQTKYAVLHFSKDNSVEPVPSNWLTDCNNFCFWPIMYTEAALRKARLGCAEPDERTWMKFAVRKLGGSCK